MTRKFLTLHSKATARSEQGFTLIELSIVLVIIGLIVGGVLSGQDLIQAAQIRATMKQKEQFDLAVNTFKVKYNALPGDYALTSVNGISVTAGDGNGFISDAATGAAITPVGASGEVLFFWQHLSVAGYIDGGFSGTAAAYTTASALYASGVIPKSKLGRNATWVAVSSSNTAAPGNYYILSSSLTAGTTPFGLTTAETALTPVEASSIDAKSDDGLPATGAIRVLGGATTTLVVAGATPASIITCASATAYLTLTTPGCQMRVQANW